jgi:peptidoglycan hydrolase-like protein with peptidoglycan-binding domain
MSSLLLRGSRTERRAGSAAAASALVLMLLSTAGMATAAAAAQAPSCRTDFPANRAATSLADIQQQLLMHGYDPGLAEGDLNGRTCRAIIAYQKDAGLQPDGIAGPTLQNQLRYGSPKVMASTRTKVDPRVAEVQVLLRRLGYLADPADGVAGRKTRDALIRFQRDYNLAVETLIDDQTMAELRKADAAQGQQPPSQAPAPPPPAPGISG